MRCASMLRLSAATMRRSASLLRSATSAARIFSFFSSLTLRSAAMPMLCICNTRISASAPQIASAFSVRFNRDRYRPRSWSDSFLSAFLSSSSGGSSSRRSVSIVSSMPATASNISRLASAYTSAPMALSVFLRLKMLSCLTRYSRNSRIIAVILRSSSTALRFLHGSKRST